MPLIILTGYPCSGKTYRASQLLTAIQDRIVGTAVDDHAPKSTVTAIHIPSYHSPTAQAPTEVNWQNRDSIYNSAALEKTARAAELSAIKRALSKDKIVVADGLNYIKGFRYQLWCESKATGTRCCTVHCAAREDEVQRWNKERLRRWAELHHKDLTEEENGTANLEGIGSDERKDVMQPQSQTAIYGDKILDMSSRSRSSSLDADDGGEIPSRPSTEIDQQSLGYRPFADHQPASAGPMASSAVTAAKNSPGNTPTEYPAPTTVGFPKLTSRPYSSQTLTSLIMRYEPPSPFSKWDTPLFTVPACDRMPPVSAIWDAIFPPSATVASTTPSGGMGEARMEVKPHTATILPQATGADALQVLERVTADIVAQVMAQAKERPGLRDEGGALRVRLANGVEILTIPIGTVLSLPMMQRLRRNFTQIQRGGIAHGRGYVKGEKAVGEVFMRFLNSEMGV